MASKRERSGQPSDPDQIQRLHEWMKLAHENSYPKPTDREEAECPQLIAFLAPQVVGDPDHKGEGKPKRVLREPMLMVTFDRAFQMYKWAITDKICRIQVGGHFPELVGFSAEIERQLAEKKCWVKELEPTRRKED
jgi:hypothetical protein